MKKALFASLIAIILLSGCVTTNEQLAMKPLYSLSTDTIEDIRGTINRERLLVYKEWAPNTIVTLDKITSDLTSSFYIFVDYLGDDWRFIDTLMLKINNGDVITLKDNSPARDTSIRGNNVSVRELISFEISPQILEQFNNCNELVIQFYNQPIAIPVDGIEAIKQFLNQ
jgi:hypothetical protein